MDNHSRSWAPRPGIVALGWGVGTLMAVGVAMSAVSGDHGGVVLFALATAAMWAFAGHTTAVRPRLVADAEGLRARTLGGTHRFAWPGTRVRVRTTRRLGRDSRTLEIESGDDLMVFGWLELGEDPRDVLDVLSRFRYPT